MTEQRSDDSEHTDEHQEEWNGVDRRAAKHWVIQREIPLAVIAMLFAQTFGMVWSISQLYGRVDTLVETLREFKQERYTKDDGRRDRDYVMQALQVRDSRDTEIERRITAIEEAIVRNHQQVNGRPSAR